MKTIPCVKATLTLAFALAGLLVSNACFPGPSAISIEQVVDLDAQSSMQSAGKNAVAVIDQSGNANSASIDQQGVGLYTSITQVGSGNNATLYQTGSDNTAYSSKKAPPSQLPQLTRKVKEILPALGKAVITTFLRSSNSATMITSVFLKTVTPTVPLSSKMATAILPTSHKPVII